MSKEQTKVEWVAQKLRELRLRRGLTAQQLANRIETKGHSRIFDLENVRNIPKLSTFLALLDALGTSPADFFKDMPSLKVVGVSHNEARNA